MKILSLEDKKDNIQFSLKSDILIPCWVYKVPIKVKKGSQINFIEKTILELSKLDNSLKDDANRLSIILGFYNKDKSKDKTDILKLMLKKISSLRLEEVEDELDEKNIDVNIYQFFQEVYSNEILPIVTKDINNYSYSENNAKYHENFYRKITFKSDISSTKSIKAFLVDKFDKKNYTYPTQGDLIKTMFIHNQNQYENGHSIDYTDTNIDINGKPELIYLHTKLYIPTSNIEHVIMTNGFTNDYSPVFKNIFTDNFQELLQLFRQKLKSDTDKIKETDIGIPFESKIKTYPTIMSNIRNIEKEIVLLQDNLSSSKEIKNAKKIAEKYYDIIEELLKILSLNIKDNKSLKEKAIIKKTAKEIGFKIDRNRYFKVFNVSSKENLQKFLAKCIIYKKEELYELASRYPKLLFILDELFIMRNGLKHADKESTLNNIDEKELLGYKDLVYDSISIILKINQKSVDNKEINNDNMNYVNAYIDLEEELPIDIISKLPQDIKDSLVSINYYISDNNDFEINKYNTVKEVINLIYSIFEFIIKKLVNSLPIDDKQKITDKEVVLDQILSKVDIGESLTTVGDNMLKQALNNKGGSLGAYSLIYFYLQDNIDKELVYLIEEILTLRKHGVPTMEEVQSITKEKLLTLKRETLKYIEKLLEKI